MSEINLWEIESELPFELICGVDEAGRGPLAGPVCAAAVILPKGLVIPGLNDSKKLSDKRRRELFPIIQQEAVSFGIAFASLEEIDEINILQATFLAMRRAMEQLNPQPEFALIDGNRETDFGVPCKTVIKGDSLWKIAKKLLGDGAQWKAIFEANSATVKDANRIYVGQTLNIPR